MKTGTIASLGTAAMIVFIGLIVLGMWGCPTYNVWERTLAGEAQLKMAEQNRKIKVANLRPTKKQQSTSQMPK